MINIIKRREKNKRSYYKHRERNLLRMREYNKKNRQERTEYYKKYRATEAGRDATQRAVRKYEKSNPKRRKAWDRAQQISKKPCEKCGASNVHRHHPNIERPMEVIFLCPLHHKEIHRE